MPPRPTIDYPSTPPPWLAHWPGEKAVREMFPEGIRRLAYRFLGSERHRRLTWAADRLVLELGSQQATWRWAGGAWHRSCTCGYPNDRCAHTYAAACILAEILRHESWAASEGAACPPGPVGEPLAGGPAAAAPAAPARGGPEAPPATPARLEVEADFHHEPGQVTLRFYRRVHDRRELLRLQTLTNLAVQARYGSPSTRWSFEDWSFLKWLTPHLQRRGEVRANLQVLKLTRDEFDHWLARWEDGPPRFIERASQSAITRRPAEPARLVFELTEEGDWVRIGAVLVLPSGVRQPFHGVFQRLAGAGQESVISGELLRFQPPVSWDLLKRVFGRRDPRMRKEHVSAHLGALLEGRLDLVEGSCVRRECTSDREVLVEASPDGSDVVLQATASGAPVTSAGAPVGGIRWDGARFVLAVCDSAGVRALRELFEALEAVPAGGGRMRVRGTPALMAALRRAWRALPEGVERRAHPDLRPLLEGTGDVRASFVLREDEQRRLVDLTVRWQCGDAAVSAVEMREALRLGQGVLRTRDGRWLALDPALAEAAARRLEACGLDAAEPLLLLRHEAKQRLRRFGQDGGVLAWAPACRHVAERLLTEPDPEPLELPPGLDGVLRPYQKAGFQFLADRCAHGVGAILADDMGLGKTLQVLALLEAWVRRQRQRGERFRALVVCPASVVSVWLEQAARFCPLLRCRGALGNASAREQALADPDADVVVTHYALLRQDADRLLAVSWDLVVLDEAQNIKNPEAQVSRIAKALRTERTLALTGTPLENRLLDLWSVMDFLNPGLLGTAEDFAARYGGPSGVRALSARLAPVILRRTKTSVAPELPPRTEEILRVEMTSGQREAYDRELVRARAELSTYGPMAVLAALTRLRQICCDPALLAPDTAAGSAKVETLVEMLVELAEEGHSSLVFSQFTSMLERLRAAVERAGLPCLMITGDTPAPRRAELVREFSAAAVPQVFLLSLRAAGTGLTLTRADYVFLYDPWWNPAVERQAIDRTHRLGQDKPVFAYRLVAADSVEEKVLALQQEKAELFAAVMGDAEQAALVQRLSAEDLRRLLA